jgi:DNA-binding MarR family transcriptional regulator
MIPAARLSARPAAVDDADAVSAAGPIAPPRRRGSRAGSAAARTGPADAARAAGCTCFRVRRLARRVTQLYDHALAPSGLRVTQFSLLSQLVGHDGVAIGALADALDMDRTTLTRNLKPLVDAGLVALAPSTHDRRVRAVWLTTAGRRRHAEAGRLWRIAQRDVNRMLGDVEVVALHRLFDSLIETFNYMGRAAS